MSKRSCLDQSSLCVGRDLCETGYDGSFCFLPNLRLISAIIRSRVLPSDSSESASARYSPVATAHTYRLCSEIAGLGPASSTFSDNRIELLACERHRGVDMPLPPSMLGHPPNASTGDEIDEWTSVGNRCGQSLGSMHSTRSRRWLTFIQ